MPGVEEVQAGTYRRSLRLPQGAGVVELTPTATHVNARFWLDDNSDLPEATRQLAYISRKRSRCCSR